MYVRYIYNIDVRHELPRIYKADNTLRFRKMMTGVLG